MATVHSAVPPDFLGEEVKPVDKIYVSVSFPQSSAVGFSYDLPADNICVDIFALFPAIQIKSESASVSHKRGRLVVIQRHTNINETGIGTETHPSAGSMEIMMCHSRGNFLRNGSGNTGITAQFFIIDQSGNGKRCISDRISDDILFRKAIIAIQTFVQYVSIFHKRESYRWLLQTIRLQQVSWSSSHASCRQGDIPFWYRSSQSEVLR